MIRPFACRWLPVMMIVLVAAARGASGQEWTRFRGPNGSGLSETTFPTSPKGKDFVWKITLPAGGHSSPVIWGDKVLVTCADEATAEHTILCLTTKDGSTIWKKAFGSHTYQKHGDNSYAAATPVVDADRVYVCWNTPEEFTVIALKLADGSEAWKIDLGAFVSQHGGGNSPILVGDVLLLGDDQEGQASFLFGIDRATGKIIWKTPRKTDKFSAATPVVFHAANGEDQAVFCCKSEGMTGINPKTGKVLWQAADIFDSRTVGSPVVGNNGLIFATCGEGAGGHVLHAIRPEGKSIVDWQTRGETPYVPTPLVKGDRLFYWSDRGMVTCADANTGKKIWQAHAPGSYYSSPICAGNVLFNTNKKGELIAISAGEKFELLGQTPLEEAYKESCHATPAISGGQMFVRTYTHLICIKGTGGQASAQ